MPRSLLVMVALAGATLAAAQSPTWRERFTDPQDGRLQVGGARR